jgi:tetratricopeptide (TPR) repeat protein
MRRVASCLIALAFLCTAAAAETPEEVFQRASVSVVVVHVSDAAGEPVGLGSGIVSSRGTVITNCHVAQAGPQLTASHLGKSFAATLQYADTDRDLCQLSVPKLDAPSVSLGDSKNLKVGQRVYAVGAPEGLELTLSEGLISALRSVANLRYIQTTASISHGSSGGGLFDAQGRLIGITTFYVSDGQNLNFALPEDWIQGLPERAKAETQASVNASNGDSDWLLRAAAFRDKSDWEGLLQLSQQWVKSKPKSAAAWWCLEEAYLPLQQFDKALEAEQEIVRLDPQNAAAWMNLGGSYASQFPEASLEAFQQAVRLAPEWTYAWVKLGDAYSDLQQHSKALEAEQQAVRLDPQNAYAWMGLGSVYSDLQQYNKALEAYQQALRLDPEDGDAWQNLGVVYSHLGQDDKALEADQEAVRLDPKRGNAWLNLGLDYCSLGRREKAIEVYQRLRQLDPDKAEKLFKVCIVP